MPVFILGKGSHFPPVELATADGVVAVGGDLSPRRLISAYAHGIFPWFSEEGPILWWSPDPRLILFPEEVHISKSMRQVINKNQFRVTLDQNFTQVIENCRRPRRGDKGTWITDEMAEAYSHLYHRGYAHSVEVWQENRLAGGLYGVSVGRCFFAESKYYSVSNASKFALIWLARMLKRLEFPIIDCQVSSDHVKSLGAREVSRDEFMGILERAFRKPTLRGDWGPLIEGTSMQTLSI